MELDFDITITPSVLTLNHILEYCNEDVMIRLVDEKYNVLVDCYVYELYDTNLLELFIFEIDGAGEGMLWIGITIEEEYEMVVKEEIEYLLKNR